VLGGDRSLPGEVSFVDKGNIGVKSARHSPLWPVMLQPVFPVKDEPCIGWDFIYRAAVNLLRIAEVGSDFPSQCDHLFRSALPRADGVPFPVITGCRFLTGGSPATSGRYEPFGV